MDEQEARHQKERDKVMGELWDVDSVAMIVRTLFKDGQRHGMSFQSIALAIMKTVENETEMKSLREAERETRGTQPGGRAHTIKIDMDKSLPDDHPMVAKVVENVMKESTGEAREFSLKNAGLIAYHVKALGLPIPIVALAVSLSRDDVTDTMRELAANIIGEYMDRFHPAGIDMSFHYDASGDLDPELRAKIESGEGTVEEWMSVIPDTAILPNVKPEFLSRQLKEFDLCKECKIRHPELEDFYAASAFVPGVNRIGIDYQQTPEGVRARQSHVEEKVKAFRESQKLAA